MRLASLLLLCVTGWAEATRQVDILPNQVWTDTGIDVRPGDSVLITAGGSMNLPQGKSCGPDGLPRGYRDLLKIYPANDAGLGVEIGRVGSNDVAMPCA